MRVPHPCSGPDLDQRVKAEPVDVHWPEGLVVTFALWSFTLLIYLPMIVARYRGMGVLSVILDSSTVLVSMAFGMLLFALFRATYRWPVAARFPVLVVAVFGTAVAQAAFDLVFTALVANSLEARWAEMPDDLANSYGAAFNYATVFAVNCALFQLAASRRRGLRQERDLADLRQSAKQLELDSLRQNLNPHFLFNTINAISAMVVTQRNAEAEQGLDRLSAFLRASLVDDASAPSPLEDQLQMADRYLQLEEMRLGARLAVAFDCAPDVAGCALPPMLVQSLVEAAIRDAVEPTSAPVRLSVSARRAGDALELRVADDVPRGETIGMTRALAAARQRLRALHGQAASVELDSGLSGVATIVRLPATAMLW